VNGSRLNAFENADRISQNSERLAKLEAVYGNSSKSTRVA
jgi:hypothetical protein